MKTSHDDDWIAHQDQFNALLSQLNQGTVLIINSIMTSQICINIYPRGRLIYYKVDTASDHYTTKVKAALSGKLKVMKIEKNVELIEIDLKFLSVSIWPDSKKSDGI